VSLSVQSLAIDTFVPMLRNLSSILDKAAAYATGKPFDLSLLVKARLAPDMYTLEQQVLLACHHAGEASARLTGREATPYAHVEGTFEELKARVVRTIDALQSTPASAFDGAEDRDIVIPLPGGEMVFEMKGYQYLRDWALPHFYFHVVTAYDILRHNGVDIGKRDYAGHVGGYIRPAHPAQTRPKSSVSQ
jgi:uncharacterized protein